MGGGQRGRLGDMASNLASLGFVTSENVPLQNHIIQNLNNGNMMTTRRVQFLEAIVKLQSQVADLSKKTGEVLGKIPLRIKNLKTTEPREIGFMELDQLVLHCTTKQMAKMKQYLQRARNMGHRVEHDMNLRNTPATRRVPDPQIPRSVRMTFLAQVSKLVKLIKSWVEKIEALKVAYNRLRYFENRIQQRKAN